MKKFALALVISATLCAAQKPVNEEATAKAIEGARLLHSSMRDPDSFKIGRVFAMKSDKYGYAICYDFYARNGFGGMNHNNAVFSPHTKRDVERGNYRLITDDNEIFQGASAPGIDARCGGHAAKHDTMVGDLTEAVQADLKKIQHPDEEAKKSGSN